MGREIIDPIPANGSIQPTHWDQIKKAVLFDAYEHVGLMHEAGAAGWTKPIEEGAHRQKAQSIHTIIEKRNPNEKLNPSKLALKSYKR